MKQTIRKRFFPFLGLALLLGSGLYGTSFWLCSSGFNPSEEDYLAIEKRIRQAFGPKDVVAVQPWWAARAREFVGDLPFLMVRDIGSEDLSHFSTLWLISLSGYHGLKGAPFVDQRYALVSDETIGRLRLRSFRLPPPAEVVYNFLEKLPTARVSVTKAGHLQPCHTWRHDRWHCSPNEWEYQGRAVVEMNQEPREVIWSHPLRAGPLEISYHEVPFGRTLVLFTGITDHAVRAKEDTPITLSITIDQQPFGSVQQLDQSGYFRHQWEISHLGPGPHVVTFRITCSNPHLRIFCFNGEIRK